ncbi:hypothetical protein MHYP_G00359250 [Metynnis hypsauchen]
MKPYRVIITDYALKLEERVGLLDYMSQRTEKQSRPNDCGSSDRVKLVQLCFKQKPLQLLEACGNEPALLKYSMQVRTLGTFHFKRLEA